MGLGNKFFETINEQDQRSFFLAIFALPLCSIQLGDAMITGFEKPEITIHMAVLLDALTTLSPHCKLLSVSNFALSNQADVQTMSNIILAKCHILQSLYLEDIECPLDYNKHKRYDDGPVRFLDPLLYASSHMLDQVRFSITARTQPAYVSLVSTNAVHALFASNAGRLRELHLCGLGLNNSHCLTITEALQTANMEMSELDLKQNPQIKPKDMVPSSVWSTVPIRVKFSELMIKPGKANSI